MKKALPRDLLLNNVMTDLAPVTVLDLEASEERSGALKGDLLAAF
ncbi:hypothetical protein ACVIHH_000032 [Bradyrhizobium sp. USDA 4518]|nr:MULTISPECIES: hypothetical protein [unclassified Bradyrhizobium]MCP1835411.1 hypothetical protein [Bradyrhizobium sp. USDA 4545]MCP1920157.1 hypothetical protein [Bradyrhizobium sp. USDA 4532]